MLTLFQLSAVREIVSTGTVTAAAHNLHRTQPAITQQMQLLEQELGCSIFQRKGRRLTLTPEGERVYERAQEIFERIEALQEDLKQADSQLTGILRVGCGPLTAIHVLPDLIAAFRQEHPEVRFSVLETESRNLPRLILRGQIDIGLGMEGELPKQIVFHSLLANPLVLVCHEGHPLARRKVVREKDLADESFIHYLPDTIIRQAVEAHLNLRKAPSQTMIEMDSSESILALVQRNLGVSLVPHYAFEMIKPGGVTACRFEPLVVTRFGLSHLRKKYLGRALRTFVQFTQERIND